MFRFRRKDTLRSSRKTVWLSADNLLCLVSGRGFLVFCHLFLYSVEQLFRNNGGNTVWNDDIAEGVFPDIAAIVEWE